MPTLSTPIGELRPCYDVVVVGSGYGASVAAYRMATLAAERRRQGRTTFSVCVLERGDEFQPGGYPATLVKAVRQMQADTPTGHIGQRTSLFDLRLDRDLSVLVGCGLGGGSLINAGVMLRPSGNVLEDASWPEAIRHHGLEEEFKRAVEELDVHSVTGHDRAVEGAAAVRGCEDGITRRTQAP